MGKIAKRRRGGAVRPQFSPVASLGRRTPGAATEGNPSIFSWKNWRPFLVASSAVSPLISSLQKLTTCFCSSLFIAFTRVSPPRWCHLTPFLPLRPRFSTIPCGGGDTSRGSRDPGRSAPLVPPSDTTDFLHGCRKSVSVIRTVICHMHFVCLGSLL